MKPIGIFGGTFDPVHFGHLRVVLEVIENFELDELRIIPCGTPPIKEAPIATPNQRLDMLRLAVSNQQNVIIDDIETHRDGPSYTVDTLTAIKEKSPQTPLYLILGTDAFLGLNRWHRWRDILTLAHIIVIHRPGWKINSPDLDRNLNKELKLILDATLVSDKFALNQAQAGNIMFFPIRKLDISSSAIRNLIKNGKSPRYLLPQDVLNFISSEKLYI
ncbi:MAG: nicotinate-nucleotide adenylyltransferase [Gammaproteobacteria bacterium]|nr:nicotinate-nucleotide adenylyltransferase [Gammaproteobacteria bacterium]